MLEKLGAEKGQVDIEDIDRNVIQEAINARRETPHMANAWLGTVSGMFDWAMQEQTDPATGRSFRVDSNPCEFVKRFPPPKKDDLDDEGRMVTRHGRTRIWTRSRPPIRTARASG
jgi:hypothetical protein